MYLSFNLAFFLSLSISLHTFNFFTIFFLSHISLAVSFYSPLRSFWRMVGKYLSVNFSAVVPMFELGTSGCECCGKHTLDIMECRL
jgi:hypothetical protein